ncbi:MAG: DUF2460 domain-containing protein [Pseudomonadota bacterium]
MSFHEIQFPVALSFGAVGGPERVTEVVTLANGFEERNTPSADSRRRYDAGFGMRSLEDVDALIAFFEARRGQLYAFRWKDWGDFKSCGSNETLAFDDQVIGTGDGTTTGFQLTKTYQSGPEPYVRDIRKPVSGSVICGIDGVEETGFSVDAVNGIVNFSSAPASGATVTAGFEFDVPVRFDTDAIQSSVASFKSGEVPNVPVVEVRL